MARIFTSVLTRRLFHTLGSSKNVLNCVKMRQSNVFTQQQSRLLETAMSSASIIGPMIQQPAPQFKGVAVVDMDFKEISLSDYQGQYVVLFFYPLDFTFVCPTELIAFNDAAHEFTKLGVQLIGVSVDSHYSHLAWMNTPRENGGLGPLRYPLLSDFNKNISRDYNVLLEEVGVALRGLFIIDRKGILRIMSVNDLPIGRSVDETLRLVEALQFYEEHGEVCPANWKKGHMTIKPTPREAKTFFHAAYAPKK